MSGVLSPMEIIQQKLGGAGNVTPDVLRALLEQQARVQRDGGESPFPNLISDTPGQNPVATPSMQRTSAAPSARIPTPPVPPGTPSPPVAGAPTPGPADPALNANLGGNPYGDPYGTPQPNLGQQVVSGAPAVTTPPTTSAAPGTLDLNVTGSEPLPPAPATPSGSEPTLDTIIDQAVAPATTAAPTPPVTSTAPPAPAGGSGVVSPETQASMPPRMPTADDIGLDINDPNFQRVLAAIIGIGGPLALGMAGRKGVPMSDNAQLFAPEGGTKAAPSGGKSAGTEKGPTPTPDSGAKSGPRAAKTTTPPASRGTMNDTFTFNEPSVGGNILRGQPVEQPAPEPKPAPKPRTNTPKSAVPTAKAAQAANQTAPATQQATKFPPIPKSAVVPVDIPEPRPTPRTVAPTPAPARPVERPVQSPGMLRGGMGPVPAHDPTIMSFINQVLARSPRPTGAIGGVHRSPGPGIPENYAGPNAGGGAGGGITSGMDAAIQKRLRDLNL